MMRVAIWLDDLRDPTYLKWKERIEVFAPEAEVVLWVKTYEDFRETFTRIREDADFTLVAVFFDNDLGSAMEGRHAFNWMEKEVRLLGLPPFTLDAQTANPAARKELQAGFQSLRRFWEATQ
jgi:hypothetical protein